MFLFHRGVLILQSFFNNSNNTYAYPFNTTTSYFNQYLSDLKGTSSKVGHKINTSHLLNVCLMCKRLVQI